MGNLLTVRPVLVGFLIAALFMARSNADDNLNQLINDKKYEADTR
jgi:hypothetical protein